jgi:hypothetical protein
VIVSDNSLHKIFPSTTQTKPTNQKHIMKKTLHTPGPWKHDPTWGIIKHGKSEICALHSGNLANANLIASAPDLLSALEFLLADYIAINGENLTGSSVPADKAREALRKAKGE